MTARQLLTSLLNPDPESRMSVDEALDHVWLSNRRRHRRVQHHHHQQQQQQTIDEEDVESEEKECEKEYKSSYADEDESSSFTSTSSSLENSFQQKVKIIETSAEQQQQQEKRTSDSIPTSSNSPTRRMLSPLDRLSFKSPPLMAQHGPDLDDIPDFSLDGPSSSSSSSTVLDDRRSNRLVGLSIKDTSSPSLPMFKDLVKRSTRFTTSVPASQVMSRIHDIVTKDSNRRVTIDLNAYKLIIEDARANVRGVLTF